MLEGFDFGVGMLLPVIGRDDLDRRVLINTIGPVWDGNEVWLLVAGGATFAAFPNWYATLFSGFYLPLFLILAALIFRGVAFEFRAKRMLPRGGSPGTTPSSGAAWSRRCCGVWPSPTSCGHADRAERELPGLVLQPVEPLRLLGGVTTLLLFALHGSVFLTSRPPTRSTSGPAGAPRCWPRRPPWPCWPSWPGPT